MCGVLSPRQNLILYRLYKVVSQAILDHSRLILTISSAFSIMAFCKAVGSFRMNTGEFGVELTPANWIDQPCLQKYVAYSR